jgi:hypothetical protein
LSEAVVENSRAPSPTAKGVVVAAGGQSLEGFIAHGIVSAARFEALESFHPQGDVFSGGADRAERRADRQVVNGVFSMVDTGENRGREMFFHFLGGEGALRTGLGGACDRTAHDRTQRRDTEGLGEPPPAQ